MRIVVGFIALLSIVGLSGCSKSLSKGKALLMFKQTLAYKGLQHGFQPDGAVSAHFHKGTDGHTWLDGETLKAVDSTGIVSDELHATLNLQMVFTLSPGRLAELYGDGPLMGSNSVCKLHKDQSEEMFEANWKLTRFDDGWRFDDPTLNGAYEIGR